MPPTPREKNSCPRPRRTTCPVCGGTELAHIRGKLHCVKCHAIVETCCDGLPE